MTSLPEIRDLATRLHSHVLEWDDRPLMDELMLVLDELQYIHDDLDRCEIPTTGKDGLLLSIQHRVTYLIRQRKSDMAARETKYDFYGKPVCSPPVQLGFFLQK